MSRHELKARASVFGVVFKIRIVNFLLRGLMKHELLNKKYPIILACFLLIIMTAASCSSQRSARDVMADDEPCWVMNDPACDDEGNEYLYFIGQNSAKDAAVGRPNQGAFDSARMNAKTAYISYIEDTISTKAVQASMTGGATLGAETVASFKKLSKTFAEKTVSGLKQLDSYYVSDAENENGTPLWSVYVRMHVRKSTVRNKFGLMMDNVQESANAGNEEAKRVVKGLQEVNKQIGQDNFFKGF